MVSAGFQTTERKQQKGKRSGQPAATADWKVIWPSLYQRGLETRCQMMAGHQSQLLTTKYITYLGPAHAVHAGCTSHQPKQVWAQGIKPLSLAVDLISWQPLGDFSLMLKMPGALPLARPLQFLSLEKAALLIHSKQIPPGYKCLVMKKGKTTNVGKFWNSPLLSKTSSKALSMSNWSTAQARTSPAMGKGTTVRRDGSCRKVTKTLNFSHNVWNRQFKRNVNSFFFKPLTISLELLSRVNSP